jgi:membrane protein insertase Oxa1/YidC/SpoIIIJ
MTASMPSALFVYWSVNNSISIVQTASLKSKYFKKLFDIPDPPKADASANLNIKNPFANIADVSA